MNTKKRIDYSDPLPADVLKQAGLVPDDIELSIRFGAAVNEAVKMWRAKLREDASSGLDEEQQKRREKREKADDDRIFLGAVTLLAQRMKPKRR